MRRLPTMLASASAAGLTALTITVAVPAIADNAGGDRTANEFQACLRAHGLPDAPDGPDVKPWLGARLEHGDGVAKRAIAACDSKPTVVEAASPSERELRACLTGHGVALPGGDGRVLKTWLLEHGDDVANRDAVKACHIALPTNAAGSGACGSKPEIEKKPAGPADAAKPAPAGSEGAAPAE